VLEGTDAMADNAESDPRLRDLGSYIRLQRQMADLSLRQLADLTQVSNAYLSQIERGLHQPSLRVLRSIANALNVSAETFLAQAGLIETAARAEDPAHRSDTEAAIMSDPDLTAEERDALLSVYRSFQQRRKSQPRL
jgi:transcriptional regulator with XRE-family HTH domain